MRRNVLPIALTIAIIFAGLWFVESPPPQLQLRPKADADQLVLAQYFNDMETVQFTDTGLPDYHIDAKRIEHRQPVEDGHAQPAQIIVNQPDIVLFDQGRATWHLQAEVGQSRDGDDTVTLQNDVQVAQQPGIDRPWQIETDSLTVEPHTQVAHTDASVIISSPGITSSGEGLTADFKNDQFEIKSKSRTRYDNAQ